MLLLLQVIENLDENPYLERESKLVAFSSPYSVVGIEEKFCVNPLGRYLSKLIKVLFKYHI